MVETNPTIVVRIEPSVVLRYHGIDIDSAKHIPESDVVRLKTIIGALPGFLEPPIRIADVNLGRGPIPFYIERHSGKYGIARPHGFDDALGCVACRLEENTSAAIGVSESHLLRKKPTKA